MTPEDIKFDLTARIKAVEEQRNAALTDAVLKSAHLALAGRKIGQLEDRIQVLEYEVKELRAQNSEWSPESQDSSEGAKCPE